jgi:type II secretory pathway component PulJ
MLEVMVSLALGSMIMIGMVQAYRNAVNVLSNSRDLLSINRRVALLLNQIERDFTTVMPYQKLEKMEKPTAKRDDEQKQGDDKKEQAEKKDTAAQKHNKEKEPPILSLITNTFDDAAYRYQNKKWQMTKQVSFICTTPLEVFGSQRERRVRVGYELVYNKQKSSAQHSTYTLWRKESAELENMEFKEKEEGVPVRKHIVAENIKALSLEYTYKKRPEKEAAKNKTSQNKEEELIRTFTWGKEEELKKSATLFPQSVSIHLELWDEQHHRSYPFDCMVPLLLQAEPPTQKKDEDKSAAGQQQESGQPEEKKQEQQKPQGDNT